MDKNNLLQITNELYRITLLFPKKEPLRYKIRELADEVLGDFVSLSHESHQARAGTIRKIEKVVEVIDSFLEIAKVQNWIKESDILSLQGEYSRIKKELTEFETEERGKKIQETTQIELPKTPVVKEEVIEISERQKKILKILREKKRAQVWEVKADFPDVSKRTLRRDFKKMVKDGLVERIGERNATFYQPIDRT